MKVAKRKCLFCQKFQHNIPAVTSKDADGEVIIEKFKNAFPDITSYYNKIVHYKAKTKHICSPCLKTLNIVHKFKQKCSDNMKSLSEGLEEQSLKKKKRYNFTINETTHNTTVKDKIIQRTDEEHEETFVMSLEPEDILKYTDNAEDSDDLKATNNLDEMSEEEYNNQTFINDSLLLVLPDQAHHIHYLLQKDEQSEQPKYSDESTDNPEKKYKCTECPKSFKRNEHLKRHKLIHTDKYNERSFQCPICPKSFKRSDNLKAHSIVHSDSKPHVCEICRQQFRHKYSMLNHVARHRLQEREILIQSIPSP